MTELKCVRCGSADLTSGGVCKFCTIEMESLNPPTGARWLESQPYPTHIFHARTPPTNISINAFDGVGDVLKPTFRLFTDNFWFITKLVLVIVTPLELLKILSIGSEHDWQFQVGTFLLQLLSNVVIAPALIFGLMKVMQTGVAPSVSQCFRWGTGKVGKLTLAAIMSWFLTGIGYLLCVVPGIAISVLLALVYPLAVLEKGSPVNALLDSKELTKGHRWKILGGGIVVFGLVFAANFAISAIATFVAAEYFAFWPVPLAAIFAEILNQLPTILSLVIYLSIRRTLEAEHAQ
jgi:hypothetical protein